MNLQILFFLTSLNTYKNKLGDGTKKRKKDNRAIDQVFWPPMKTIKLLADEAAHSYA